MKLSRISLLIVLSCCFIGYEQLFCQEIITPFGLNKPFSVDVDITINNQKATQKINSDGSKIRTETNMQDMQTILIIRPDQNKFYSVMPDQKKAEEATYSANKLKDLTGAATPPEGKFEMLGPDMVNEVACIKYKVTGDKDKKVYFVWVDGVTKFPVKLVAEDNTIMVLWKNYKAGPQDISLFEVPAGYQVKQMPTISTSPNGK